MYEILDIEIEKENDTIIEFNMSSFLFRKKYYFTDALGRR